MIIGIDPGKKGGLVALENSGQIAFWHAGIEKGMDIVDFILTATRQVENFPNDCFVYVEKSQPMPKQGVSSTFTYAQGFGEILGVLQALEVPFQLVTPSKWTKVMLEGVPTSYSGKERARFAAIRLFPGIDLKATLRCKKPHEGLVDALLIAEYGRRLRTGQKAS